MSLRLLRNSVAALLVAAAATAAVAPTSASAHGFGFGGFGGFHHFGGGYGGYHHAGWGWGHSWGWRPHYYNAYYGYGCVPHRWINSYGELVVSCY